MFCLKMGNEGRHGVRYKHECCVKTLISKQRYFEYKNGPEIMDDHVYVNIIAHIPTIDIIEYDPSSESHFNKHWHTHKDDMNNIDRETLNAVGQTLLEVVYRE